MSLMCWGFRGSHVEYIRKSLTINLLIDDLHVGAHWYSELHLCASITIHDNTIEVIGTFDIGVVVS